MEIIMASKTQDTAEHFRKCLSAGLIDFNPAAYRKWQWKYAQNPFFPSPRLPVWTAVSGGGTVGYLGTMPVELKAGAGKFAAAWAVDFKVSPQYRKMGIGMSLVKEANRHFDVFLAVGGTPMSSGLFMKMGWVLLGRVPYYIKIWNSGPLLKSKIKNLFAMRFVSAIIDFFLKLYNYIRRPVTAKGLEVCIIYNFDEYADLFWKQIEGFYGVVIPRTRDYLSWKYDSQPDMEYIKFCCRQAGRICGYAVARVLSPKNGRSDGSIVDIIARPGDEEATRALISAALEYLKRENCSLVRCCVNDKGIQKILADFGFIKRKPQMSFLIKKNLTGAEELYRFDKWFVTSGDSDIDR